MQGNDRACCDHTCYIINKTLHSKMSIHILNNVNMHGNDHACCDHTCCDHTCCIINKTLHSKMFTNNEQHAW